MSIIGGCGCRINSKLEKSCPKALPYVHIGQSPKQGYLWAASAICYIERHLVMKIHEANQHASTTSQANRLALVQAYVVRPYTRTS
jgi:hypothetical protein